MKYYFGGCHQVEIAKRTGVDQSTISLYSSRFKRRAGEIGLLPAGKEYGMHDEVEALRSISVELAKANLTVEEAKRGNEIIKTFMKYGVNPEQYTALVRVCKEINDPGFINAALRLGKIENESHLSYQDILTRLEHSINKLSVVEKGLDQEQIKLNSTNKTLAQKRQELEQLQTNISNLQNAFTNKKAKLEQELAEKMKQVKVKDQEVNEVANLKISLAQKGLDIATLVKLSKEL